MPKARYTTPQGRFRTSKSSRTTWRSRCPGKKVSRDHCTGRRFFRRRVWRGRAPLAHDQIGVDAWGLGARLHQPLAGSRVCEPGRFSGPRERRVKGLERKTSWSAWRRGGLELFAERGRVRSRFNTARRVFSVLDLISLRKGITAKTLSKELGVSLSTCCCLINILVEEGYVEKLANRQDYRLHSRAHSKDIEGRVEPVVEVLALCSNRQANFGLLSDGDVTVARIESPRRKPPLDAVRASCTTSPWAKSRSPVRDPPVLRTRAGSLAPGKTRRRVVDGGRRLRVGWSSKGGMVWRT